MKQGLVTALDIGSANVRCVLARLKAQNQLEILGIAEMPSEGLEKGIVRDIQATADSIQKALKEAQTVAGTKPDNIYANVTGDHIRSLVGDGRISIPTTSPDEPGEITQEDLDQVIADARNGLKIQKGFERSRILHGIPQGYVIDGHNNIRNPLRMTGFHLITKVLTIFGDVTQLRNLAKSIELAGFEMASENFVLNHIAVSKSSLSDDERRLGTILIDIGAGTCDISLHHRGILEKVLVVPMAGSAITDDLAIGLKTTHTNAEYIKTHYGVALASSVDPELELVVEGISGRESQVRTQYLVSHVVQHRVEEMLSLCYDRLKNHYTPELVTAGVVLTGGSAKLQMMDSVVNNAFNLPVKIATPDVSNIGGETERLADPAFATCVGLLRIASEREPDFKAPVFKLGRIKTGKALDKIKSILKDFTKA
ncbi:MAG: cell division protein FtsA [Candidatus Cloacimonadaceae bacterium]|nr:cell division protein FtsA [Candidatus Cloacimonadota bacterium]MDX9950456.1 cell division protein FtsA [Candidatus Syntrophosphaera sp.]NLN84519.1 cell division protein FtsA [Candidatus Cloacimonadota bacterium]